MHLQRVLDNQEIEADIDLVNPSEFRAIRKSKRFEFDWEKEGENQVYKIFVSENGLIVGLISLVDISYELRIHINLIEVSNENVGKKKEYHRIAGCLLAFAARKSFGNGYGGFISLMPKTLLIDHYCNQYGFQQFGRYLGMESANSNRLIQKYLDND